MAQIVFEPIRGKQMWFPVIENNDHLAVRKISRLCCLYILLGERGGHRTPSACVMRAVGLYVSPVWRIVTHLHFEQFQSRGPCVYAFGDLYDHREYILCCLLTAWSRVLESLAGFQLVKKFLAFYATRRFFSVFTRSHHLTMRNILHYKSIFSFKLHMSYSVDI
jgi:hypothetical protein